MQPFVVILFLLSGIAGLTLEVVWTRMLEHVFGATTLAISTVLTVFMGGMALGSFLFGRIADRIRRPLLVYGILEGVVGVCALIIPVLISGVYPDLNRWMVSNLSNSFWQLSFVRFVAVAAVLIVPSTCMGATLPLLSRHMITTEAHVRKVGARVGALYTVNTFGAVLGVFSTTFILLPSLGLSASNVTAACIDLGLFAAVAVWYIGGASEKAHSVSEEDEEIDLDEVLTGRAISSVSFTSTQRGLAAAAFFVSGLASMNLQVVWNRAMAMIIGASVYSFSLVLIAFLVGLAGGAAVFSRLSRRIANPLRALGMVEVGIAAATMLNYLYMDDLPHTFARLVMANASAYQEHVGIVQFLMFSVASLAVLPATFFMGATFPLTIRIVATGLERVGRDVGRVYALNTLGAICGSFLSAFVFVPVFSRLFGGAGMQVTFFLSVALYAGLGAVLLLFSGGKRLKRGALAAAVTAACAAFVWLAPSWDPAAMTIGVFRLSLMKSALDEESWGDPDVRYYYDGVSTTVSVEMWGRHFALKNNGKVDASNGDDMPTQIMVAAYPLLLHPKGPQDLDVAIVGFGSGVTVGSALQFPVEHVDVVELENAVVEASRFFGSTQGEPEDPEYAVNRLVYRSPVDPETGAPSPDYDWRDPETYVVEDRLTIHNNDGRNYLASTPKKYDVIISEPSNPWITGVSNMFTKDNFESAIASLAPGGIYGQWVQLYELSPENIKTIFRTFASVFPHVVLFSAEDLSSDTILLGSFEPIDLNLEHLQEVMADERVRAELERAFVLSPSDVLARILIVDSEELWHYTNGPLRKEAEGLPINTDDNAIIEFAAPRDLISYSRFAGYLSTIYSSGWQYGRLSEKIRGLGSGPARAKNAAETAASLLANGRKGEAAAMLKRAWAEGLGEDLHVQAVDRVVRLLTGDETQPAPIIEEPVIPDEMARSDADALRGALAEVNRSVGLGAFRDALETFEEIPKHLLEGTGPQMLLMRGYLFFLNAAPDDFTACEEAIEPLSQIVQSHDAYLDEHPEVHYLLGLCHDNALHFDKAVKNIRMFVRRDSVTKQVTKLALDQAEANLEAEARGFEGTAAVALPPDLPGAPTTDAPGETPKSMLPKDS